MVWYNMAYLQVVCWVCTLVTLVSSTHFLGGMVWWRPVNPTSSTDTRVEIIQRFSWVKVSIGSSHYCDSNLIAAGNHLIGDTDQLTCRSGCSGGIADMKTYCTDFGDDWVAGERSHIYNPGSVRVFEASYASGSWRSLNGGGGSWEFRVRFNLNLRSDTCGINTSPVFNMPTVVKIQRNCPTTITIPVKDIDGDDVRCRWASSSRGECGGVCQSFTSTSTLRDCAITYSANSLSPGWYAVALQIEDFASLSSTVALSSVPLQFLVEVVQPGLLQSGCSSRPTLIVPPSIPNGRCILVPVKMLWTTTILATSSANISNIVTSSPRGFSKTAVSRTPIGSQQYTTTISWTPTQFGPHVFCYYAEDSNGKSSNTVCITLIVDEYTDQGPLPVPGVLSPSTLTYIPNTQAEWTLRFDREIRQPTSSAHIRVYEEGKEVQAIDVSSSAVTFLSSDKDALRFRTNYNFVSSKSYYVLVDEGVAIGTDYCGLPSSAVTSTTFWTLADTLPFQIKLGRIDDCIAWSDEKTMKIQSDIRRSLVHVIMSQCNSTLPEANILDGVFNCQDLHDQITYRSTIVGTESNNATTLLECIQDWVTTKPKMTLQWYNVNVDNTCPVGISSISDPECGLDPRTRICIARCNPN